VTEATQHQPEEGPLPRTREAVDWWLNNWGARKLWTEKGSLPLVAWQRTHDMAVIIVFYASVLHYMMNNTIGNGVTRVKGQIHIPYEIRRTPIY